MMEEGTGKRQVASPVRTALLQSAISLFNEKGYDAVTVEEITRRAGTAKGSFYTYFRTKSDVILEEYLQIDEYCRQAARNLDRYSGVLEKLLALTREQMRYIRDQVGQETLKRLYVNNILDASPRKVLLDPSRASHELALEILREGQAAGELAAGVTADRLALFLGRALRSVCLDWILTNGVFDLVREGQSACQAVIAPFLAAR